MRIDGNAAAVVGDGQKSFRVEFDLDEGGMACERLVHRVVDDFGEQMMERFLVGPADIHAGRRRTGSSPSRTSMSRAV